MKNLVRRIRQDKGQAITEFVLILPLFVLLLFSMIEMGRIFNAYIALTAAAREGGREAAISGCGSTVTTKVRDASAFSDSTNVSVDCGAPSGATCTGTVNSGGTLCVKASYSLDIITPIVRQFFPGNVITIYGKTTMRRE